MDFVTKLPKLPLKPHLTTDNPSYSQHFTFKIKVEHSKHKTL